jgi:nickel-type superoxide dismutase maturation protease
MSAVRVRISGDSMWPTYPDGTEFELLPIDSIQPSIGDVVLTTHPFHSDIQIVKRIQSIDDEMVFLVGDNPDPTASEDSHNFGKIHCDAILGVCVPREEHDD